MDRSDLYALLSTAADHDVYRRARRVYERPDDERSARTWLRLWAVAPSATEAELITAAVASGAHRQNLSLGRALARTFRIRGDDPLRRAWHYYSLLARARGRLETWDPTDEHQRSALRDLDRVVRHLRGARAGADMVPVVECYLGRATTAEIVRWAPRSPHRRGMRSRRRGAGGDSR